MVDLAELNTSAEKVSTEDRTNAQREKDRKGVDRRKEELTQ